MEDEEFEDAPQGESVDEALSRIVEDDEGEDLSLSDEAAEETPEPSFQTEVDDSDMDSAMYAFRRDGRTSDEIEALLQASGAERFVQRGLKRAKHYEQIDATFNENSRLKALLEVQESGNDGDAHNAGPTLNPQALVTPLAERLGLDEEGSKDLIALLEASSAPLREQNEEMRKQLGMLGEVVQGQFVSDVRREVGLDQVTPQEWDSVQKNYQALSQTELHSELQGKERMSALLRTAAQISGVETPDPKEIQRKASVARARKRGAVASTSGKKTKPKPKGRDERVNDAINAILAGKFSSLDEATSYGRQQVET